MQTGRKEILWPEIYSLKKVSEMKDLSSKILNVRHKAQKLMRLTSGNLLACVPETYNNLHRLKSALCHPVTKNLFWSYSLSINKLSRNFLSKIK